MGCFTACFRKKQKSRNQESLTFDHRCRLLKPVQPVEKNLIPEIQVNLERELSLGAQKRVTFDEIIQTHESTNSLDQIDRVVNDEEAKDGSSPASSPISHLPNNRYLNCRDSSDDETDLNADDLDSGDDEDGDEDEESLIKKVWTEAIPPASMELDTSVGINDSSPIQKTRNRTGYNNVCSVLNPVENISQWKVAKIQGTTLTQQSLEKENHDLIQSYEEPTFSSKSKVKESRESLNQEISVEASLSNWLDTPGTTTPPPQKKASYNAVEIEKLSSSETKGSNPMWSIDDRPILGALTVEEIKQFSAPSTPKRSPNRSPEDMPIIGTVGTYWSNERSGSSVSSCYKGTPNATRKYREDKKMDGHSTSFKTRIDRASRTNSPRA